MGKLFKCNIFVTLLFIIGAFLIPDCFVSRHVTSGVLGIALLVALNTIILCVQRHSFKFTPLLLGVLLFSILWLSHQFFHSTLSWYDRIEYISLCLLFFVFGQENFEEACLKQFYFVCLIMGVFMSLWGIFQYVGLTDSYYAPVRVTGSFENPAGISAFLSALFPFSLFFVGERNYKLWGYFASSLLIITIVLSNSRTGVLAVIVTCILYGYKYMDCLKWRCSIKRYVFLGIVACVILLLVGLYFWKKGSADGRMLIWLCSWNMFLDHWFLGVGSGKFQAEYMIYQAEYFHQHPDSVFGILADNIKHPFNEYVKILVEYGTLGFSLLLVVLVNLIRIYRCHREKRILIPVFGSLLAMGISACFSYPFNYPGTCVALVLCLVIITSFTQTFEMKKMIYVKLFKYVVLICMFWFVGAAILWGRAEFEWCRIANASLAGKTEEMLPRYREVYRCMKNEGLFLYNYGAELYQVGRYRESLEILNECSVLFNDVDLQLLLAENYVQLGMYTEAERKLLIATSMCPVRFVPLYKLMNMYLKIGNMKEVNRYAKLIVDKSVKIPSLQVDQIKNIARKFLEKEL